jgi:methylated-DNA-[protein]-cysteine S-methyltransferase
MTMKTKTMDSPLGTLRLFATDELVGVYLPAQHVDIDAVAQPDKLLDRTARQLDEYFAGRRTEFDLPLGPRGTGFQQLVWRALTTIPFGDTRSYGEQARSIGRPSASRAVGAANGKNPISIIVPCHRVIAGSGELTGYAGGMDAKRWLLDHERVIATRRARVPACSTGTWSRVSQG